MPELGQFFRTCRLLAEEGWNHAFLASSSTKGFCERSYSSELVHQSFHFFEMGNFDQLLVSLPDFSAVILPVLTFSFIDDILSMRDSDPFVRCVLQALIQNIKILALTTNLEPKSASSDLSNLVKHEVRSRFDRLKEIGIDPISLENLSSLLIERERIFDQKLITEEDILGLQSGVRELRIGKNTIVSPLAIDRAKEKGIEIIRE